LRDSKSFGVKDVISIQESDMLRADWKNGSFVANIWRKGELKSFLEVV
jgi:hypothetical protein